MTTPVTTPTPTFPLATLLTTATSSTILNQIKMALALIAQEILSGSTDPLNLASAQGLMVLLLNDPNLPSRVAFRIVNVLPSAIPSDSQILSAVAALVPSTGSFTL